MNRRHTLEASEAPAGLARRDRTTPHASLAARTAGGWLAAASLLMVAVLALHGPIAPDMGEQMTRISHAATRWRVAHWMAAASLSLYAVTGLLVLTSASRLTRSAWTLTAWAVVVVGALWTVTTASAEATVVTQEVISGSRETFEAWWAFAEGKASGFVFVALAVAVIAAHEARSPERATPRWSAHLATALGVASFVGWALGMWLGVRIGSLLWVASSMLMSVWTLSFGVGLMRSREDPL
jgi:hypothetical protein